MPRVWDVPVRDSTRVRDARVAAESAAALAGLDERRTAAAALVATELATNLLKHAEGGQVLIDIVTAPALREDGAESRVVQITTIDHGPGIPDLPAAMSDGFSTTSSLGAGLGTCQRLADDFALHSTPGRGTVAVARVGTAPRGGGGGPTVRAGAVFVPGGRGPATGTAAPAQSGGGALAGGWWPGGATRAGDAPVGTVACGTLTGHAAVPGDAAGFPGRAGSVGGDGSVPGVSRRPEVISVPGDGTRPTDSARPQASSVPGDGTRPTDSARPQASSLPGDGTRPTDSGRPQGSSVPGDGSVPGDSRGLRTSRSLGDGPGPRQVSAVPGGEVRGPGAPGRAGQTGPWGDRSVTVAGVRAGGVNIPYGGAEYSGDAWAWVRSGDRLTLMLADGLGHGPEAARASSAAVTALHRWAHLSPAESLRRLHDALKGTRGAAVALAQLDVRAGRLRFAGIGNVGARLRADGTWRPLLSRPGIVGVHRPGTLREEEADWAADRLLVLHTDGLPSRWTPPSAGLPAADPAVTAALAIRDASSPARPVRDDTAVAVLTPTPPERP